MSDVETPDAEAAAASPPAVSIDTIIDRYIKLRDKKAAMKKEYDQKVETIDAALDKVEAYIKRHLESIGGESIKTPSGTAYITTKTSATVADKEGFLSYVREQGEWGMLDVRANKTAVDQFRQERNDLPPGINWTQVRAVNVRR